LRLCAGSPLLRVRGNGDCTHLDLVQSPEGLSEEDALAAWLAFSCE